jgi:RNA polymerase primary sigma factor
MRQLKITRSITNRESASLEKYLQEIAKEPMISPDEEASLAVRLKRGDQSALEKLAKANLRFVVSVAKQYQGQGLSLSDLINEGNLGLIKAARKFDETKGFKFISYAVWWIRQSILQALAEQARMVRLPLNQVGNYHRIKKVFSQLEQKFEREPSPSEIAEAIAMNGKQVEDTIQMVNYTVSMDAPLDNEDGCSLSEMLTSPDSPVTDDILISESLHSEILRLLRTLSQRESEIVKMFYGIGQNYGLSLDEIGEKFDLTRERVRQIKENAIRRLKHKSRSNILRGYLG